MNTTETARISMCSCGHMKAVHRQRVHNCTIIGCNCNRFWLDGYTNYVNANKIIPLKVGGDWI